MFQNITQIVKASYSFNDSKPSWMASSCRKKIISIIKRSNKKQNKNNKNKKTKNGDF